MASLRMNRKRPLPALLLLLLIPAASRAGADEPEALVLPLSVEEAVERALAAHRPLRETRSALAREERKEGLHWRERLPRGELQWSGMDGVVPGSPDSRSRRFELALTVPLYDGGRGRREARERRYRREISWQKYERSRQEAAEEARKRYWALPLAQQEAARLRKAAAFLDRQLGILRAREAQGRQTGQEEESLALQRDEKVLAADQAAAALEEQEKQFRRFLDLPEEIPLILTSSLSEELKRVPPGPGEETLTAAAVAASSALAEKEEKMRQTRALLLEAAAPWKPEISSRWSLSFEGEDFPLTDPQGSVTLEARFPWELFPLTASLTLGRQAEGSRNRQSRASLPLWESPGGGLRREEIRAQLRRMVADREELILQCGDEVHRWLRDKGFLDRRKALGHRRLTLLRTAEEVAEEELRQGRITRLTFIQRRQESEAQEQKLAKIRRERLDLHSRARRLWGTRWRRLFSKGARP